MAGEGRAKIVVGRQELEILRALLESGGCVEGLLVLINKAYHGRWHTKRYLRAITKRIYRMEEKGLIVVDEVRGSGRGRPRKRVCITPYGVKAYYSRV